jgi:hypothetical protein
MKRASRPVATIPFDEIRVHAKAILDLLAPFKLELTMKDRNRRLKFPKKSAGAVVPLLHLAKVNGIEAYAAPIVAHSEAITQLVELRVLLGVIDSQTTDLLMRSETETWQATTTIYTMLRRFARTDGELEAALLPIVQKYFARKRSSSRDGASTEGAATEGAAPDAPAAPTPAKKTKTKKKARRS